MEIREFARKIPNKSFLYFASFTSIIPQDSEQEFLYFASFTSISPQDSEQEFLYFASFTSISPQDSEQEFFVFCFIHFHYSARFRTRVFCILLHSLPLFRKIPNKEFLYFAEWAKRMKQNTKNKKQKNNIHYYYNTQ